MDGYSGVLRTSRSPDLTPNGSPWAVVGVDVPKAYVSLGAGVLVLDMMTCV